MFGKIGKLTVTLLLAASTTLFGGTKEEIIRLQRDVLLMQKQVLELQKSFDSSSDIVRSLLEQLNDQIGTTNRVLEQMAGILAGQQGQFEKTIETVRQDVLTVNVKLDETNNRVAALHQKMDEAQKKVENRRIPYMDAGGPKPDQIFHMAYNDYIAGNYELAAAGFRDFLADFSESEYADNAAYYLGVSLQLQGRLEPAIDAFDQVINLYPNSDYTPSAYFKKAVVEQDLQKNEEAIESLKKLIALFPEAQEATLARQQLTNLGIPFQETSPPRRRN